MARATLLLLFTVLLAGCGGNDDSSAGPGDPARLLLDSEPPGAVHAGIYMAAQRGFDDAEGVQLQVERDPIGGGGARLLRTGRVDMAVMDVIDLVRARARSADLVAVMALVQQPVRGRSLPVVVATATTLRERRALVAAAVRALQRGYLEAQTDPESAVAAMLEAEPSLSRATLARDLDTVAPSFTAGADYPGQLRPEAFSADIGAAFDTTLAVPLARD